ncbi:fatty acid hydroxylase domain containing 2 [Phyllostomus discolor]|uniref:Fatty acid hydroxylase domain containing 2 n=1 Tax=Phyllostomus discolor TaxID=89673 RepID=A0A833YV67_9CHIR|nr:fatty acid hydroxylase domain containing 2 [Phyllostomus discolor]
MIPANPGPETLSAPSDLIQGSLPGTTPGKRGPTAGASRPPWSPPSNSPLFQVSNMLPAVVGPLVMGSHLSSIVVWSSLALVITTISHCGYHLPFLPSPEFHDYHHLKFNQCYGVLGVLDHLHGTDTLFKQTKAYERHTLLLSLTPLSESIPDSPKME